MIFVTGDTHGSHDLQKLKRFADGEGKDLTKNDYMFVTGDFGVLWSAKPDNREMSLIVIYNSFPFTTLFIDGNHENHERLSQLPTEEKFGADVGKLSDSIFHLRRGRIYSVENRTFWTFGGGYSIDKASREEFISWWSQELPTYAEMQEGFKTIMDAKKVDYIITHTAPRFVFLELLRVFGMEEKNAREELGFQEFLQTVVDSIEFKLWLFGHFHADYPSKDRKFVGLYQQIIQLD